MYIYLDLHLGKTVQGIMSDAWWRKEAVWTLPVLHEHIVTQTFLDHLHRVCQESIDRRKRLPRFHFLHASPVPDYPDSCGTVTRPKPLPRYLTPAAIGSLACHASRPDSRVQCGGIHGGWECGEDQAADQTDNDSNVITYPFQPRLCLQAQSAVATRYSSLVLWQSAETVPRWFVSSNCNIGARGSTPRDVIPH